jgi:small-conductance mechanosensitive channel
MSLTETVFLGNSLGKWLTAAVIAAVSLLILILLKRIGHRQILAYARKTETRLDDMIAALVLKTKPFFLAAAALYLGAQSLNLAPKAAGFIGKIAVAVLLLQGGMWATELLLFRVTPRKSGGPEGDAETATTLSVLHFLARIGIWATVLLLALDNFGVKITTLLAGLGVSGVALALATQNILGDLFASLSIVLDKPFIVGDFIVVDDYLGSVEKIGVKTTRLRSLSGEQLIFGNSDLLKSRIRNYKRMQERRVSFTLGVVYQTPADKLESVPALVREIIEGRPGTRFDRAHFKTYGPSSLDFEAVYWVLTPDYLTFMDTQQAINLAIFRRFAAEGIEFAYPTQTVYLPRGNG